MRFFIKSSMQKNLFGFISFFFLVAILSCSSSSTTDDSPLLSDPYEDTSILTDSVDDFDLLLVEKNPASILGVSLATQDTTVIADFDSDSTDSTLAGLNGVVVSTDNQNVYVVDSLIGSVIQVDISDQSAGILYIGPSSYKSSGSTTTPSPAYSIKHGISSNTLWTFSDDTLLEIDSATGSYDEIFTFDDDRTIYDFVRSGSLIYAIDSENDQLIQINTSTDAVTTVVSFGEDSGDETAYETATSISLSSDASLAYVTARSTSTFFTDVLEVNLSNGATTQIASLDNGMFCSDIETTSDNGTAYVSCSDGKLYNVTLDSGAFSVILENLDRPYGIAIMD